MTRSDILQGQALLTTVKLRCLTNFDRQTGDLTTKKKEISFNQGKINAIAHITRQELVTRQLLQSQFGIIFNFFKSSMLSQFILKFVCWTFIFLLKLTLHQSTGHQLLPSDLWTVWIKMLGWLQPENKDQIGLWEYYVLCHKIP